MKLKPSHPVHETPAERVKRVCTPLPRPPSSPSPMGLAIALLAMMLGIVFLGIFAGGPMVELVKAYTSRIWELLP